MALSHLPERRWLIAESTHWALLLNKDQSLLGRCFLLLKRPETDPLALAPEELSELWLFAKRTREILGDVWEADHFNYAFLMNIDKQVHFHIIPRYQRKREFAGGTYVDPEFGGHYNIGPARTLDDEAYNAVIAEIQKRFQR
jgi:diadenosine tetraphosphate (Ap4A) HIT family hydrolase